MIDRGIDCMGGEWEQMAFGKIIVKRVMYGVPVNYQLTKHNCTAPSCSLRDFFKENPTK